MFTCVRERVHSSASVSACACMSARVSAPVFVCMCLSVPACSTVPSHLSGEGGLANQSSHAGRGRGGDVKINRLTCTHELMNSFKTVLKEPLHPSFYSLHLSVPSEHQASLPNTTEMPLRQNATAKLDHHPCCSLSGTYSCFLVFLLAASAPHPPHHIFTSWPVFLFLSFFLHPGVSHDSPIVHIT